jgi:hypothetical protein
MGDTAAHDHDEIAELIRVFFAAFASGAGVATRLDGLREVLLPSAVIVMTCGGEPTVYDVDGFIEPREALLSTGRLEGFREWELPGRTQVFGDIGQHFCAYEKSWLEGGVHHGARGMKAFQLVRTGEGWRISAVAWDDERTGPEQPRRDRQARVPLRST